MATMTNSINHLRCESGLNWYVVPISLRPCALQPKACISTPTHLLVEPLHWRPSLPDANNLLLLLYTWAMNGRIDSLCCTCLANVLVSQQRNMFLVNSLYCGCLADRQSPTRLQSTFMRRLLLQLLHWECVWMCMLPQRRA